MNESIVIDGGKTECNQIPPSTLATLKTQHPETEHDCPNCGEYTCAGDRRRSDRLCDQRRLVNRIEVLEGSLRAILEEHYPSERDPGGCCLCRHVEAWPCSAAQYARAALEGKM